MNIIETAVVITKDLALILALAMAYAYLYPFLRQSQLRRYEKFIIGFALGLLNILVIFETIDTPMAFACDPRAGPTLIAGIVGGLPAAFLTILIGASFNYWYVADSFMAINGALSFLIFGIYGIFLHHIIKKYALSLTIRNLFLIGGGAVLSGLPLVIFALEWQENQMVTSGIYAYYVIYTMGSTLLVGFILDRFRQNAIQKESLRKLQEEDSKLSLVARHTTNAVIITDEKGSVEWVNDGFTRMTGYALGEIIGKKPAWFLQGPATDPATVEKMSKALANCQGFWVTVQNYKKDGTTFWNEILCQPVKEAGKASKFIAIEMDSSEKLAALERAKKAENVMITAIQALDDGFVLYDKDDKFILCNDKHKEDLRELSQLFKPGTKFETILRQRVPFEGFDQSGDQTSSDLDAFIAERLETHRNGTTDVEQQLKNGRWVRIRERRTADGGYVGFRIDITALKEAQLKAEAANRAKSEFLASMSHEIRTPMTAVLGFADGLLRQNLDPDSHQKIANIKEATTALLQIINDILDITKLEAHKIRLVSENVALEPLIRSVEMLLCQTQVFKENAKVKLHFTLDPSIASHIITDPVRLRQILINLIGNALKFTQKGRVDLRVKVINEYLYFEVEDTGIGITADVQKVLFDNFTQADSTISQRFGGTGLGLAICKRLVTLMGGEISVNSIPNKGSLFTFTIPYRIAKTVFEPRKLESCTQVLDLHLRDLNILIAEDSVLNQTLLLSILAEMGHRGTVTNNGKEVVDMLAKKDFDLILMDIRMPLVSGLEATKIIRQMPGDKGKIPIIALTADIMEDSVKSYMQAGIQACLAKPYDLEKLKLTLQSVFTPNLAKVTQHAAARNKAKPEKKSQNP